MANKLFCDGCDKEIGQIVGGNQPTSVDCDECPHDYYNHKHYHMSCVTTLYGKKYCGVHVVRAKNDQLIREYVTSMWKDMGFEGKIAPDTGKIETTVGPLNLAIEPVYDRDAVNLNTIELQVSGLAEKVRKFKANLLTHDEVVRQLQGAIVRSLRSTKSAITVQRKQLDEKVVKIDVIINVLMGTLGTLPDPKDVE